MCEAGGALGGGGVDVQAAVLTVVVRTVHEADCCEEPEQGPLADCVQQDAWQLRPAGPDARRICGCC
jgi:hypothetical protein